jgi:ubiquinone/menaquinone biosynthesis C-methylase UbiE
VSPGQALVALAGVRAGMEVLDAPCGAGDAAVAAAELGATVVAVDPRPEVVERARRRDRRVDWLVGDVEALEFEDDRFDRVLSIFGVTAASRPAVVAGELARVCTPGGRIALTARAEDEAAVRELFAPRGVHVDLARPAPDGAYLAVVATKTG